MIEYIILAVAFIGTLAAGIIDLKTTEIPDYVPLFIGASGIIIHLANSAITGVWSGLFYSFAVGAGFLALGYIMFYTGQWGEADVLILGSLGFLIPQPLSIFNASALNSYYPLIFILNVFIVGGIYSIFFAAVTAFKTKGLFENFFRLVVSRKKEFASVTALYFACFALLIYSVTRYLGFPNPDVFIILRDALYFYPTIIALYILYIFTKVLDNIAFRWHVDTKNLKEGDVLAEDIISGGKKLSSKLLVGLEMEDIEKIRKAKKKVWIKGGVCYAPTFFLALAATIYYGNVLMYIILAF